MQNHAGEAASRPYVALWPETASTMEPGRTSACISAMMHDHRDGENVTCIVSFAHDLQVAITGARDVSPSSSLGRLSYIRVSDQLQGCA